MEKLAPRPLVNLGNTCYLNAILQPLARIVCLKQYFVHGNALAGEGPMTTALRKYMKAQWNRMRQGDELSPSGLLEVMGERNRRFKGRQQQDAHEALRVIFEAVCEEERKRVKAKEMGAPATKLEKMITGTLVATVVCDECAVKSEREEPFLDLPLQLVPKKADAKEKPKEKPKAVPKGKPRPPPPLPPSTSPVLRKPLAAQPTPAPPRTNLFGSLFRGRRSSSKRQPQSQPPPPPPPKPSASYVAARTQLREENVGFEALTESLAEFSRAQVLSGDNAYACERCAAKTRARRTVGVRAAPRVLVAYLVRFGRDAGGRLVKRAGHVAFEERLALGGVQYRLVGVTRHGGSLHGGHYVAMVRDEGWWLCNDSRVRSVEWDKVRAAEAYLLFYERV